MKLANIKIRSDDLEELKKITGEKTGQKAVEKALRYIKREAKQRSVLEALSKISFQANFNPLKLRRRAKTL